MLMPVYRIPVGVQMIYFFPKVKKKTKMTASSSYEDVR